MNSIKTSRMKPAGIAAVALLIVFATIQCPSCNLLTQDTNPATITRSADTFMPTATDICSDLIAYEPGPKIVQDCEAILTLLDHPDNIVLVSELRPMVGPRGLIEIYLEYTDASALTPGEKIGFRATAEILQDTILRMLGEKPLTLLDPQWRPNPHERKQLAKRPLARSPFASRLKSSCSPSV